MSIWGQIYDKKMKLPNISLNNAKNGIRFRSDSVSYSLWLLHSIHKRALDFVEDDDAEEEEDAHEGEAVTEGEPGEIAFAKGGIFEDLDDGGHRVQHDHRLQRLVGDHRNRIDDRRGIHPQLNDEAE